MLALSIMGLLLGFIGSGILAFNSIRSRGRILKETSTGQVPHISEERRKEVGLEKALEEELLTMPDVKAAIWQSTVSTIGLGCLTLGFILQLTSVILPLINS